MPICEIDTNVKLPANFTADTTKVVAESLGKPPSYVAVIARVNERQSMGGTEEPCAAVRLNSIGALGKDVNQKHATALTKHIQAELGVPPARCFISFVDLPASTVALGGNMFG